jgi:hypothetical protein
MKIQGKLESTLWIIVKFQKTLDQPNYEKAHVNFLFILISVAFVIGPSVNTFFIFHI